MNEDLMARLQQTREDLRVAEEEIKAFFSRESKVDLENRESIDAFYRAQSALVDKYRNLLLGEQNEYVPGKAHIVALVGPDYESADKNPKGHETLSGLVRRFVKDCGSADTSDGIEWEIEHCLTAYSRPESLGTAWRFIVEPKHKEEDSMEQEGFSFFLHHNYNCGPCMKEHIYASDLFQQLKGRRFINEAEIFLLEQGVEYKFNCHGD